ncbi:MAG: M23 family metallopeptidase [Candidatus Improbicoccus devescovinae]|nr:MAG: M23 family metallopeptidase [Candidatus Improbicoccus devescovinae]
MLFNDISSQKRRGLYLALGICLFAVVAASYTTYNSIQNKNIISRSVVQNAQNPQPESTEFANPNTNSHEQIELLAPDTDDLDETADNTGVAKEVMAQGLDNTEVGCPIDDPEITKKFSQKHVHDTQYNDWRTHPEINIIPKNWKQINPENTANKLGDPVCHVNSVADGSVIRIGANNVIIDHKIDGKSVITNYANITKISVKKGQNVDKNTKLGLLSRPCLLFSMKENNKFIDPTNIISNLAPDA